jgi:hypothetical protein
VRIDSLEPHICDAFEPRILLHPKLILLIDELENWPEKQPDHHYDGLTALHILWMVATTRSIGIEYTSAAKSTESDEGFGGHGAW